MSSPKPLLQFQPPSSYVDVGFWLRLSKLKLHEHRLESPEVRIRAAYGNPLRDDDKLSRLSFGEFSFSEDDDDFPNFQFPMHGILKNVNTIEEFKALDKAGLLRSLAEDDPSLLNRFLLLSFVDIKHHQFYYWMATPALHPTIPSEKKERADDDGDDDGPTWSVEKLSPSSAPSSFQEEFLSTPELLKSFCRSYSEFLVKNESCFVVVLDESRADVLSLSEFMTHHPPTTHDGSRSNGIVFGFVDMGSLPNIPGWNVRNFLLLLAVQWNLHGQQKILCFRDHASAVRKTSEILRTETENPPEPTDFIFPLKHSFILDVNLRISSRLSSLRDEHIVIQGTGWERNARGKLGARMVDLRPIMDPKILATTSSELNLQLMRWRAMPKLQLETIANTRCLLIGAGTLGCAVGRCLLGWGVKHITFVDNGKVSYSNPVRQSLFTFQDSIGTENFKAEVAARNLNAISPSARARGVVLTIPMPGHSVSEAEVASVQQSFQRLKELIAGHDCVFLLTDSRESRWLPTLLCQVEGKLCMNAALGFDTYLVMRHGQSRDFHPTKADGGSKNGKEEEAAEAKAAEESMEEASTALGCYFCSSVDGPTNTLRDRSLDQQCTVTRPGLSFMASALLVELFVAVLHHPLVQRAPAATPAPTPHPAVAASSSSTRNPFPVLPHQLRGFLSNFTQITLQGEASSECTACSEKILETFQKDEFGFLLKACNVSGFLEEVSGLAEMKLAALAAIEEMGSDEEDDF